jgi:hypothetical protein
MYIFTKAGPSKKTLVSFYAFCFYFNVLTMDNAIGKPRTQLCPLRFVVQSFTHIIVKIPLSSIDGAAFSLKSVTKKYPSIFKGLIHSSLPLCNFTFGNVLK